jgi:hypothetical protein
MILDLFRKEVDFVNIQGYDDIKDIVKRALDAEDNYNLLIVISLFILARKGIYTIFFI